MPRHLIPVLLALLIPLGACTSTHTSLWSSTYAGGVSTMDLEGENPRVSVENLGPGILRVRFLDDAGETLAEITLNKGETTDLQWGTTCVVFEGIDEFDANWVVRAWETRSMILD